MPHDIDKRKVCKQTYYNIAQNDCKYRQKRISLDVVSLSSIIDPHLPQTEEHYQNIQTSSNKAILSCLLIGSKNNGLAEKKKKTRICNEFIITNLG